MIQVLSKRSLPDLLLSIPINTNNTFPNRIDDSAFPFHLMPSNIALLTQSHKAIAAKKKARREQIKEITFDDEARRYVFISILFRPHSFFSGNF